MSDSVWRGTDEDAGSENDLDDSIVMDPFADVDTGGGDYADNGRAFCAGDWDVAAAALCETTELNPVRYPAIQDTPSHSKAILSTIANTKMLSGITSRMASDFARLQEVGRCDTALPSGYSVPQACVLRKWIRDDSTDNRLITDDPQSYPSIHPTTVIELIQDALRPENRL